MVAYGVNDHSILRIHGHPNNQTEDRMKDMLKHIACSPKMSIRSQGQILYKSTAFDDMIR